MTEDLLITLKNENNALMQQSSPNFYSLLEKLDDVAHRKLVETTSNYFSRLKELAAQYPQPFHMVDFDMLLDHRGYYKGSLDLEIVENEQLFGLVTTSREYGIVLYLEDNKLY